MVLSGLYNMNKTYTQEQLEIELLKQKNEEIFRVLERIDLSVTRNFDRIDKSIESIEANQKWLLSLMGAGFIGILGLISHGFKWII